jgi:hypothetical protein
VIPVGNGKVWKNQAESGIILLVMVKSRNTGDGRCRSRTIEVHRDLKKE